MKIQTINIKEDFPSADVAVANLEIEIESLKNSDCLLLKVIHGYGSHGVGGEIKKQMRLRLEILKKQGIIKDYINGEMLGVNQIDKLGLYDNFPELVLDNDLKNYNSGITLVLLKK